MADCKYLAKCAVWKKFNSDIKNIWIKNYCKGDKQERCARKLMGEQGKKVPVNMLPNGTTLED
ncbi:MAG: hypothetical protein ABFS08_06650 [Pseudomonadota bacterium]